MTNSQNTTAAQLPASLGWMADAPLFIDEDLVGRFYDAVVRPAAAETSFTVTVSSESLKQIQGKLGLDAEAKPTKLLELLSGGLFGFGIKGSAEVSASGSGRKAEENSVTFQPINTPQRQLEQLVLHYLLAYSDRIFLDHETRSDLKWAEPESILKVPRSIAFIDLPGLEEADEKCLPRARIIPTAAEFSSGEIVPIYLNLQFGRWVPPKYPETVADLDIKAFPESLGNDLERLKAARKAYWQEFTSNNFNPQAAMVEIENAARGRERIQWIDYRVPLTNDGRSLHLHLHPQGKYDTGDFAYNFVKRGHKHGLRIIGTVKSEPDMNVMAVYEK